jgi:hypothetical protein
MNIKENFYSKLHQLREGMSFTGGDSKKETIQFKQPDGSLRTATARIQPEYKGQQSSDNKNKSSGGMSFTGGDSKKETIQFKQPDGSLRTATANKEPASADSRYQTPIYPNNSGQYTSPNQPKAKTVSKKSFNRYLNRIGRGGSRSLKEEEQLDELRKLSDDQKKKLQKRIRDKHDDAWEKTKEIRKEKKSVGSADTKDMDTYRNRLAKIHNKLDEATLGGAKYIRKRNPNNPKSKKSTERINAAVSSSYGGVADATGHKRKRLLQKGKAAFDVGMAQKK